MFTAVEQQVIDWLRKMTVATMAQMRQRLCISHMTVVRALGKFGYYTSYNHNSSYYVLQDVPEFDDWGLWTYHTVRFSQLRTLPATIVAVVEKAPAGLTVNELGQLLQVRVGNVVSRLANQGRVGRERFLGRQVVYLSPDPQVRTHQLECRRREQQEQAPAPAGTLPSGCSALDVIEVLRGMILKPDDDPARLARRLQGQGTKVTSTQVRRVLEHYAVKKKRPL